MATPDDPATEASAVALAFAGAFTRHLAVLADLAPLRDSDPAALLVQAELLPRGWAGQVDAGQAAVLEARRLVLVAGALLWLARFDEANAALDAAEAALQAAGPGQQAEAAASRMRLLHNRAYLANRQHDHAGSFRAYLQALALAQAVGDDRSRCRLAR